MAGFGTQFGSKRFGMELDDSPLVVSSPWLNRFYSDFTLPPSMNRFLGGGSITETSDILTVGVALGVDGDWQNNVAPVAWTPAHSGQFSFDTVFKYEARMPFFTSSGGEARAGIVIYKDQDNGHEFGHYSGDAKIYITRWYAGSGSNTASTGALATPTASPHTYRVYWNPTSRPLFIQDGTLVFTIAANNLLFYYRVGDAGTWTLLLTYSWEWTPGDIHFGLCAHNYAAQKRSVSAKFSHALVYQWDGRTQRMLPLQNQVSFS